MKKVVFLDRDGTLNHDPGFVHKIEDLSILPNVIEGLKLLQDKGFELIIVTNQSGIGRGYFTEEQSQAFTSLLVSKLAKEGIIIKGIFLCPHHPDNNCPCRKPNRGLLNEYLMTNTLDKENSFVIGDETGDIKLAENLGIKSILLKTGKGGSDNKYEVTPTFNATNVLEAARIIIGPQDSKSKDHKDNLTRFVDKFSQQNILVIGDLMLDEYVYGDVERISPEAPVPVLKVNNNEFRLGGATNVAFNVISLGGKVTVIGQIGEDQNGDKIIEELNKKGINHFLIRNKDYSTISKTRVVSSNQQLIRIDKEEKVFPSKEDLVKITEYIKQQDFNLIIISDYDKGIAHSELINTVKQLGIKIVADPKPENLHLFRDVFAVTPNIKEAREATRLQEVNEIGAKITKELNTHLILTRGKDGASLFDKGSFKHYYLPTQAKEVFDVSGAGDTFTATLALAVASGASLYEATSLGNLAAGKVVGKFGTSTINQDELKSSFCKKTSKIKSREDLKEIIQNLKLKNKKTIFTNGCFDILHVGHTKLLQEAKSFGDVLILAINSDSSIKKIKGPDRPINNQQERAEVLAALEFVDYIVIFDESTPCQIISELKPDIHVKGGDYDPNNYQNMPEAEIIHGYGGEVRIINIVEGKSTTGIIKKINTTHPIDDQ